MDQNAGLDGIIALVSKSPYERLSSVVDSRPDLKDCFSTLKNEYEWFLETTNVSSAELLEQFEDKAFKEEAFNRAEIFGDSMYEIVHNIADEKGYLRYLLI